MTRTLTGITLTRYPLRRCQKGDGVSAGTLYLVRVRAFEELSGRMPLEALVRTRFMVLAEFTGDR